MADPLSITTGILTLLSTIGKTTIVVAAFVKTCREARRDLLEVSQELLNLQQIFEWLKDDTEESNTPMPNSLTAQIVPIISSCRRVLERIQGVVHQHSCRLGPARWAMDGKKEVRSLRGELAAYTGVLNVTLEMVTIVIARDIKIDTVAIRDDTAELKLGQEQLKLSQEQILAKIEELQLQLPLDVREDSSATFVVNRYLDSLTSYAESVMDYPTKWSEANAGQSSRESSPSRKPRRGRSLDPDEDTYSKLTPILLPYIKCHTTNEFQGGRHEAFTESGSGDPKARFSNHDPVESFKPRNLSPVERIPPEYLSHVESIPRHHKECVQDSIEQAGLAKPPRSYEYQEDNEHLRHIARMGVNSQPTGNYSYSLPQDGSPIIISKSRNERVRAQSPITLSNGGKSQTDLLIEYFEEGQRRQAQSRRHSVRVKANASSKSKSRPSADHIQVTEGKRTRQPNHTRRGPSHVKTDRESEEDNTTSDHSSSLIALNPTTMAQLGKSVEGDTMLEHSRPSERGNDSRGGKQASPYISLRFRDTVHDALRRLNLPELTDLKKEQSRHEKRNKANGKHSRIDVGRVEARSD